MQYFKKQENNFTGHWSFELQLNEWIWPFWWGTSVFVTYSKVILCFRCYCFLNQATLVTRDFQRESYSSGMVEKSLRIRKWFCFSAIPATLFRWGMFTLQYVFCSVCKIHLVLLLRTQTITTTFAAAGVATVLHWLLYHVMHTSRAV